MKGYLGINGIISEIQLYSEPAWQPAGAARQQISWGSGWWMCSSALSITPKCTERLSHSFVCLEGKKTCLFAWLIFKKMLLPPFMMWIQVMTEGKKNIQLQPGRARMWRSYGRFCWSTTGGADSLSAHIGLARTSHMVIATAREAGKYSLALCSEGGWDRFRQHIVVSAKVINSSFHYMNFNWAPLTCRPHTKCYIYKGGRRVWFFCPQRCQYSWRSLLMKGGLEVKS